MHYDFTTHNIQLNYMEMMKTNIALKRKPSTTATEYENTKYWKLVKYENMKNELIWETLLNVYENENVYLLYMYKLYLLQLTTTYYINITRDRNKIENKNKKLFYNLEIFPFYLLYLTMYL